jgi:hypothetical protein
MQSSEQRTPGVTSLGGAQVFEVDLYDTSTSPPMPLWEQEEQSVENDNLALASLSQPFWHDTIRIRLPDSIKAWPVQTMTRNADWDDLWTGLVSPCDSLLIVGYPYGYSTMRDSPTPIVLTRHVAAISKDRGQREVVIDGGGAPGMSGGPVFFVVSERIYLYGMYLGIIYPDTQGVQDPTFKPELTTALGLVCPLTLFHHIKFSHPVSKSSRPE